MQIVLASTSKYRAQQLTQLGIRFQAVNPLFDEEAHKTNTLDARTQAEFLARSKAESLKPRYPAALIIGGDQVLEFNSRIYGKPGSRDKAIDQLHQLQGHWHQLITSISIVSPQGHFLHTNLAKLKMRSLSPKEIRDYIDFAKPLDCAGSYKIECGGIALMEQVITDDFSAIQGVPQLWLTSALRQHQIQLFMQPSES